MKDPRISLANMAILACVIYIAGKVAPVFSPFFDLPQKEQILIGVIVGCILLLVLSAFYMYREGVKDER